MIEITAKNMLSAKNSINIYRGCTHGCIYCDSRSEIYGKTYNFEDIEVKINAAELLNKELGRKKSPAMITTGAMTDPYLPLEKELGSTKRCLEVIERHGFGVAILTKSDLILRDIDILKRINKKAKCVVQMTLTTFDEDLCRILEPNVCTTKRRFEVLKEMQKAGIPTIVWLTPTLPFINDTTENVNGILGYCKSADVKGVLTFGMGMTLRYGNREYFYKKLDEHFAGLKAKYMRTFGASYGIGNKECARLNAFVKKFCAQNGMMCKEGEIFNYIRTLEPTHEQTSLFD